MAGRPRTMARKVAQLRNKAGALEQEIINTCPEQYFRDPQSTRGPRCDAWREAVSAVGWAFVAVDDLVELLEARVNGRRGGEEEYVGEERPFPASSDGPIDSQPPVRAGDPSTATQ